jgi:hypothetical protein
MSILIDNSLQSGKTYKIINVNSGQSVNLSGTDFTTIIGYKYITDATNEHVCCLVLLHHPCSSLIAPRCQWVAEHDGNAWTFKSLYTLVTNDKRYISHGEDPHGVLQASFPVPTSFPVTTTKWTVEQVDPKDSTYRSALGGFQELP